MDALFPATLLARCPRLARIAVVLAGCVAALHAQTYPGTIELEIRAGSGAQHESWTTVEHTAAAACRLRVWAESESFDPELELEQDGRILARDDDSGGGTTALITLPVEAGVPLLIRAGATDAGSGGTLALGIVELADDEAVRAAVRESRDRLDAARARHAEARYEDARGALDSAVDRLIATPETTRSESAFALLDELSREALRIEDPELGLRIERVALDVAERIHPQNSRAVAVRTMLYANALRINGRVREAVPLNEAALATMRRVVPPGHRDLLITLANMAGTLNDAGELARARDMLTEATDGFAVLVGREHEIYLRSRINLANTLMRLGELQAARRIVDASVTLLERTRNPDDSLLVGAQSALGGVLLALGDLRASRVQCERVLESCQRTSAPDSVSMLQAQMGLGNVLMAERELDASAEYLEAAFRTASATRAPDDPLVLKLRGLLTELALYRGDFARALEHARFRQGCLERDGLRCDDREMIESLAMIVLASVGLGDLEGARAAQLRMRLALEGRSYDDTEIQNSLAQELRIRVLADDPAAFEEVIPDLARRMRSHLATSALSLAPREAEAVAQNRARLVSDLLTLTSRNESRAQSSDLAALFGLVEALRGIGGRALRIARLVATEAHGPEVESARRLLRDATGEIAAIVQDGGDAARLQSAVEKKERAQRSLHALLGASFARDVLEEAVTPAAIASRLAPDEAAVGYWIHEEKDPRLHPDALGPERMIAFVVRADASLVRVDLGSLAPIAEAVRAWRDAVVGGGSARAQERGAGDALRRLVVDPVRRSCGDARHWTVALDGPLHLVPLDALPDGEAFLGDRISITIRPTLGEIVTGAPALDSPPTLVTLGAIDYGADPSRDAGSGVVAASFPRGSGQAGFASLAETAREVDAIAALFRASFAGCEPRPLAREKATKAALIEHADGARWLHVATHGFFGFDPETTAGGRGRAEGDPTIELRARQFAPLVLCGLALAGANHGGVITAEELAALDLSRCELVVLSACDTNVGTPIAGQGIASFQKALHAAGARTVVTSSWKVPDEATRELMSAFYRGFWQEKLSKSEALRRAKSALRARRAPTRDWAGWILSGEG